MTQNPTSHTTEQSASPAGKQEGTENEYVRLGKFPSAKQQDTTAYEGGTDLSSLFLSLVLSLVSVLDFRIGHLFLLCFYLVQHCRRVDMARSIILLIT